MLCVHHREHEAIFHISKTLLLIQKKLMIMNPTEPWLYKTNKHKNTYKFCQRALAEMACSLTLKNGWRWSYMGEKVGVGGGGSLIRCINLSKLNSPYLWTKHLKSAKLHAWVCQRYHGKAHSGWLAVLCPVSIAMSFNHEDVYLALRLMMISWYNYTSMNFRLLWTYQSIQIIVFLLLSIELN